MSPSADAAPPAHPNFKVSPDDLRLIMEIAGRAGKIAKQQGGDLNHLHLAMDLCVTHNSCPLDLQGLLDADPFNFTHDIAGIMQCLDRETGRLSRFLPRFAKEQG